MNKRRSPRAVSMLVLAAALASGCATSLTPAQRDWMARRDVQPLSWEVAGEEEAKLVMERALSWIGRFSMLLVKTSTDSLIQTESHSDSADARIAYSVVRTPLEGGRYRISVAASSPNLFSQNQVVRSAHSLAYYAASGIEYPG